MSCSVLSAEPTNDSPLDLPINLFEPTPVLETDPLFLNPASFCMDAGAS
jgi:hypothetical protein